MKYIFQNYEIDFLYENSYNNITLNIENIDTHTCYIKEFTIDTFNKLQFEKNSNINNVKSGIHFFEKVFNNQSGYSLHISENPHLLSNFKKINILNLQFKGILEEYFEIYCHFDIEEKTFNMEEKVMRMMEKIKGNYEYKINNIETQLNNLQNIILNFINNNQKVTFENNIINSPSTNNMVKVASENNIIKSPSTNNMVKVVSENNIIKSPSTNNMVKVVSENNIIKSPSTNNMVKVASENNIAKKTNIVEIPSCESPFIGLNYEESEVEVENKKNVQKNIVIEKSKKNIKELTENQTNFYDTFYLSEEDEIKDEVKEVVVYKQEELIPKKMFITHYQSLVQSSTILNVINKWYNFVNNSDEHIILNIEKEYANIFVSNHGKIFIFHCYGGLVNEISLQHYDEIKGFENSTSIKEHIEKIKVLFDNIVHIHASTSGDSRIGLLNFFKKFDLFIENVKT